MALAFTLGSCEDNKMEWGKPDGHGDVTLAEIPLDLQEKIANYDFIKAYAAQAGLLTPIGLGVGADLYMEDETYRQTANDNFIMFTTGNAMKHESVVSNKGELNFEKIDAFFAAIPEGAPVYGHNFLWHTQQKQQYLKSLIAPEVKIDSGDNDDVCENIVANPSFEKDFEGYTGLWGKYTYDIASPGRDDNKCAHFLISDECVNTWDCQLFYTIDALEEGVTYAYQFYAKSDASVPVQFIGQNEAYGGLYKDIFEAPSDWVLCTGEFTYEGNPADVIRVGVQFGSGDYVGANVWIDDFKFGKKSEKKPEDPMENILFGDTSDFEGGTIGSWNGWGNGSSKGISEKGQGHNSDYCLVLTNPSDGDDYYVAQSCIDLENPLEVGVTYMLQFDIKAEFDGTGVQFCAQNSTTYSGEGYANFEGLASAWQTIQHEYTPTKEDMNRILINFGKNAGTFYIDNVKFGKKKAEQQPEKMINVMMGDDSDFEGGTLGNWNSWGNGSSRAVSEKGEGNNSDYSMVLTNPADGDDYYVAQACYALDEELENGVTYLLQFDIKTDIDGIGVQFCAQKADGSSGEGYANIENLVSVWQTIEHEYTPTKDGIQRFLINFGKNAGTFYIDNVKFGKKLDIPAPAAFKASAPVTRAGGISYILKTPEQKREALLDAMESWIKGMAEHVGDRVVAWDVINEPISDSNGWRGIDGFGGNDTAPEESTETGLKLNWDNGHFYWGYYLGKEYATKAFEYARKYAAADAKLFVNDYNLEISPNKTQALIDMVKYIDENNETGQPIVDGIGTQLHLIAKTITHEQIDAMFKALAATGKLVRITELDVRLGDGLSDEAVSASAEDLILQGEVYRWAIDSYIKNVPEAQRHGITIWDITDNTSWYSNYAPCIFDSNFNRKPAYKGVCDGLAGRDVSEDFTGNDWAAGQ